MHAQLKSSRVCGKRSSDSEEIKCVKVTYEYIMKYVSEHTDER